MVSQKHPKGCLLGTRLAKGCYIDTPYFHVVNKTPCIAWKKVTPRGKCGEIMIINPAEGKPRERFDWLLPGESQSPVIYNIKCSSDQFG